MNNYKRIGLYGVSGTGKTTIMKAVSQLVTETIWLEGSKLITNTAGLNLEFFKKLSDKEKYFYREKAIVAAEKIQNTQRKHIVIDGHMVFVKGEDNFENVMTDKDASFYTDYIYLNLPPEVIFERLQSDKSRVLKYTERVIKNWIDFELQEIVAFCKKQNVNLKILNSTNLNECVKAVCVYINR